MADLDFTDCFVINIAPGTVNIVTRLLGNVSADVALVTMVIDVYTTTEVVIFFKSWHEITETVFVLKMVDHQSNQKKINALKGEHINVENNC